MHASEYSKRITDHNRYMRERRTITTDQLDRIGDALGYARKYIHLSTYVIVIAFAAGLALGLFLGAVVL